MPREKKKYEHGAVNAYTSRSQALKKLQLSLKNFSRLCILKGVHPHEPRNQKQLNKGGSQKKIWFYTKDVQYLAHEPIIEKFREQTVFLHKMRAAKQLRDSHKQEVISQWEPTYELARIIRERYPTLPDALRDMSDALSLLFTYGGMPAEYGTTQVSPKIVQTCRRLSNEWMHYVIATRSLKKTFVSLKGIYYQVQVMGVTITWIVGHKRATNVPAQDVDFNVMGTFIEYYQSLVGFVNSTLFRKLGVMYPLKVDAVDAYTNDGELGAERIFSLTRALKMHDPSTHLHNFDVVECDTFDEEDEEEDADLRKARRQQKSEAKLPTLFKGLHIYVNVETPQESLAFIIRSCGGNVSSQGVYGETFSLSDARVTHQISERPNAASSLRVCVVQPQWIYDCVNARALLATQKYTPGSGALPPHYSPFVSAKIGDYVPEERLGDEDNKEVAEKMGEAMLDISNMGGQLSKVEGKSKMVKVVDVDSEAPAAPRKSKARHKQQLALNAAGEQRKLRELMIAKKHKRVYAKLVGGERKKKRQVRKLMDKKEKLGKA